MPVYFLDSSAVVKRYVQEPGTAWMLSLLEPASDTRLYIARIAGAEVIAAFARRGRSGNLSADAVTKASMQFRSEFSTLYRIVEIAPTLIFRAMDLAQTHVLRGYDAVQLAAALSVQTVRLVQGLPALTLVSADGELNVAAAAEGLPVEDPTIHA